MELEPTEWWGPDLTHPVDPPERHPHDEFRRAIMSMGRAIGKKMHAAMAGVSFGGVGASASTHESGTAFDINLYPGARHAARRAARKIVKYDIPACHIKYPTSTQPVYRTRVTRPQPRSPKKRYINRR